MALRTTTLAPTVAAGATSDPRTRLQALIRRTSDALSIGTFEALPAAFAEVAGWDDDDRVYQGRKELAQLVFSAAQHAAGTTWQSLYLVAARELLEALEAEPCEPVLLNYAGVMVYELAEYGAAEELFRAAERLDPSVPHLKRNLRAARARKRAGHALPGQMGIAARELGAKARRVAGLAKPPRDLTLSLCMIVKDEEEMLPGCLAAVCDHVDEIVVVDTGSTDRTVEIAESFGAKVVRFPWNGSFADARNASLDAATGDWVMYLDADEHFVAEDAPRLRELLSRTWRAGFYLTETNFTGGEESGSSVAHLAMRIWRHRPERRFVGRIHEQITDKLPTYLPERFEPTALRLLHYGYLKTRIHDRDKSRRNLELLREELRENPTPFTHFNIGSEHLALGEADEARNHLDIAWRELRQEEQWELVGYAPLLATRVARARLDAGDTAATREALEEGLAAFPGHTDLVFIGALAARDDGDLEEAERLVRRCLEMGDAPARYSATVGSGSFLALALLADVRERQGDLAGAEAVYRRCLEEHPAYVAPVLPLASLMLRRGAAAEEVEAVTRPATVSAMALLATALHESGQPAAAERWFRRVLERQPGNDVALVGIAESLLSQRRYAEAAAFAAEPCEALAATHLARVELFARTALGEPLGDALARAAERELDPAELALYRFVDGDTARPLPPAAAVPAAIALEALLRVEDVDAFVRLLPAWNALPLDPADRHDRLARIYFRRGFLESAAEEWIASVEAQPTTRALVGLAQIAVAQGQRDDARVFADAAVALDPTDPEARRLGAALAA